MEKESIDRINELGRLMRQRELTAEEKEEQRILRERYIQEVRRALRGERTETI
ncbi:MAG: DUF896 domain-containing protein [Clostridia bacterium]|nr:DUF896 domain-containing protein [Clostridia bacterium]